MLVRIVSVLLALVVLLGVPGFAQPQYEDFLPLAPPRDPASEPLVPAFGQQLGWTRYLTAVAGRVPTILYTHQSHALALRFPSVWTLIEVQIGDPDSWTLEWRPNLVLVQPAVLGGRTNLTMFFSDGRILQAALVEVSARAAGRHGQVYVGPESWLASQLVATLPDRLRVDAQELALTELLAEPETLVARLEGTYEPFVPLLPPLSSVPDPFAADLFPSASDDDASPPASEPADPSGVPSAGGPPDVPLPPGFPGTVTPEDLRAPLPDVFPAVPPPLGNRVLPAPGVSAQPLDDPSSLVVPALGPRFQSAVPLAAVVAGSLPDAPGLDPLVLARILEREQPPRLVLADPASFDGQSFAPPPALSSPGAGAPVALVSGPQMAAVDAEVRALRDQLVGARRAAGERVAAAVLQADRDVEQWRTQLPEQVQMSLVWDPPVPPWSPPLWHWGAWHDGRYTYIRMLAPDPQFYDVVSDRVLTPEVTDLSLYAIDGVYDQLAVTVRDPQNRGSLVQVILRRRVELERP